MKVEGTMTIRLDRRNGVILMLAALSLTVAGRSMGAKKGYTAPKAPAQQQQRQQPARTAPPARPTSNPAVGAAQSDVQKAQAALTAVHKKLEAAFLSSGDWTAAQTELQQAQSEYQAATKP